MKKIITFIIILLLIVSCKQELKNTKITGVIFGTSYSVLYYSEDKINYEPQFDSLFYVINKSLSTYQLNSDISQINRNEAVKVNTHFATVFNASKEIYNETEGIFDPTIGVLVNAWDFGPNGKTVNLDSLKIDSLMQFVGFDRVFLSRHKITKPKGAFLDFNAIAKGYAVDVITEFLESKKIENYLVEIGGEIRAKGINIEKQSAWKVAIEKPRFDGEQSLFSTISLQNEAMATSGTYRKFKIDAQGNRYSHIINSKTGYPSKTRVLSVSVIANNCMMADGYATAFQAMGIEKVKLFLKQHPELKVFIIFENGMMELEMLLLNGFPE